MGVNKEKRDFSAFKLQINRNRKQLRVPMNSNRSYSRWGYSQSDPVAYDFTLEEIQQIIRSGDLASLRELSRYYYRVNSAYRNAIDLRANLPLYDTMVIPNYPEGKGSKTQIIKAFYNACKFVDNLDVANTFSRITKEWLKTGIYNGILQENGDKVVIQDLPLEYCRTRFKDFNNLPILEFSLLYFENIHDDQLRAEALSTFPEVVQEAWAQRKAKLLFDPWVQMPAGSGGVCFTFCGDMTPPLIGSIPELKKLDDAVNREGKRDENELYKLLIQQMPIDSNGELVFDLDEVADIHASVADMLAEEDTVDVLTTFGDTTLENLQESSAASQTNDRLEKYRKNVWNALGNGEILFNPDGSASLAYNLKKEEAMVINYLNAYETWIKFQLNERFARTNLTFDFKILPTTVFNRQDLQQMYISGAQYGYSKMFAGVAIGIKQMNQLSLMDFENELLEMPTKMIPLQSSYTTSGSDVAGEEKNNSSEQNTTTTSKPRDITNKGGRPELPEEQKSEKTQANIAAAEG